MLKVNIQKNAGQTQEYGKSQDQYHLRTKQPFRNAF
jgi:hypothetical protein